MTTISISPASPIMSASAMQEMNRARDIVAEATESASRTINSGTVKTGLQIPSQWEARSGLQSSSSQIARLQANPGQAAPRAALEAYTTQVGVQASPATSGNADRSLNINMTA
jgi:hypothetical protein